MSIICLVGRRSWFVTNGKRLSPGAVFARSLPFVVYLATWCEQKISRGSGRLNPHFRRRLTVSLFSGVSSVPGFDATGNATVKPPCWKEKIGQLKIRHAVSITRAACKYWVRMCFRRGIGVFCLTRPIFIRNCFATEPCCRNCQYYIVLISVRLVIVAAVDLSSE